MGNQFSDSLPNQPLAIIHVLRAPVGGLFRHVLDLAKAQIADGHNVGIICDTLTGGQVAQNALAAIEPGLKLGLTRVPMKRNPSIEDIAALRHVIQRTKPYPGIVIHSHGSKGGVYARLPGLWSKNAVRAYTPHGGSFNYRPGSMAHKFYMKIEKLMSFGTDLFLFESDFIRRCFVAEVGTPKCLVRTVMNGISPAEFEPVVQNDDAVDFLYIGELRAAKGIDTLIDAFSIVHSTTKWRPKMVMVGTGADFADLQKQVADHQLSDYISFAGGMPARKAFALARVVVVPSRAESMPYILLEAAGAQIPIISTNVGGIPEIFGPQADRLIPCDDPQILAQKLIEALEKPRAALLAEAAQLSAIVAKDFTIQHMLDTIISAYREALALKFSAPAVRGLILKAQGGAKR